MLYTEYLKQKLAEIVALKGEIKRIETIATDSAGRISYPVMSGRLESIVTNAARSAESALQWATDHIEPAEREAGRFVGIFESIGIDLDESTLATLELIGKTSSYRSERISIRGAIEWAVADVQQSERAFEHEQFIEAIEKAGFIRCDNEEFDGEGWIRGPISIEITTEGRKRGVTMYSWKITSGAASESGKSGEFHRLLAMIAPPAIAGVE